MKKMMIAIIILILIVSGVIFYLIIEKESLNNSVQNKFIEENQDEECDLCTNQTNEEYNNESLTNELSEGGISGEGGENSEVTESKEISSFPGDLENQPCGFYSGEYGIEACGGYCEIGICVTEGRSCYCKKT